MSFGRQGTTRSLIVPMRVSLYPVSYQLEYTAVYPRKVSREAHGFTRVHQSTTPSAFDIPTTSRSFVAVGGAIHRVAVSYSLCDLGSFRIAHLPPKIGLAMGRSQAKKKDWQAQMSILDKINHALRCPAHRNDGPKHVRRATLT